MSNVLTKRHKPAWTQAPLSKTPTRALALRYVARGWAASEQEIYVRLSDAQRARRAQILKEAEHDNWLLRAWRHIPLSDKFRR